jgi:N6-adenosine-specific RNA methylase IME4
MGLGGSGSGRAHSEKPEEAYQAAEKLMPNAKRLDLFSRKTREGWTAFGDEAGTFDDA